MENINNISDSRAEILTLACHWPYSQAAVAAPDLILFSSHYMRNIKTDWDIFIV